MIIVPSFPLTVDETMTTRFFIFFPSSMGICSILTEGKEERNMGKKGQHEHALFLLTISCDLHAKPQKVERKKK